MSDTLQTFCVSKPILFTSISILWRTWSPVQTHCTEGDFFLASQYKVKFSLCAVVCVCLDLGDRDGRAGLHHQRNRPDTRHDMPGRTGPPAGKGELWPGSDAWPTPGIAWTLQSGICGETNVKIRKISGSQQQNILLQLHALGTGRKTRKPNFFRCSVIFLPLKGGNVAVKWRGTKMPVAHLLLRIWRLHFELLQMSINRWEFQSAVK